MVVKLQSTASDMVKERDGDRIASLLYPGVIYRVRSIHYEPFANARDLALQNLARKHGDQPAPRDETVKIVGALIAEHLLLGWEGFDIAFTTEVAKNTLADPSYRELVADVEVAARKAGKKRLEFEEDLVKN